MSPWICTSCTGGVLFDTPRSEIYIYYLVLVNTVRREICQGVIWYKMRQRNITTGYTYSDIGGPARLPAQVAGRWGAHKLKIAYGDEKNILYWADQSNEGRTKISCTGTTSPEPTKVGPPSLWKKPFCFSFPPENSRIKDRKSSCQYQNNLSAAHRVFLNYPCQKSYGRKIPARNNRYGRKIPAFWSLEEDFLYFLAGKGNARKFRQVTTDTAGKSGCQ